MTKILPNNKKQPKLKCKKIISCIVNYADLDEFISSIYDKTFNFASDQEANNYSSHDFNVLKKAISESDDLDLKKWLNSSDDEECEGENTCYLANTILQDLCFKGLIDPGYYVVNVSW